MRWLAFSICVCASGGVRTLRVELMDLRAEMTKLGDLAS